MDSSRLLISQSRVEQTSQRKKFKSLGDVARSMKIVPLAEVAKSIARANKPDREMHGPLMVYVVNFSSKHPHPHKFVYPICTKEIGPRAKQCGKSLEFSPECDHDSFALGAFRYVYRFKVIVIDYHYNGMSSPMRCNISEAASYLLGIRATEFSKWTDEKQDEYVTDRIAEVRPCQIYLEVKEGDVMVHIFRVFDPVYPNYSKGNMSRRPLEPAGSSTDAGNTWTSGSTSWIAVVWNSILKKKAKGKHKEEEDEGRPDLSIQISVPLARTTSNTVVDYNSSRPIFLGSSSKHKGKIK